MEMTSPHRTYEINSIIDLLRAAKDSDIKKWLKGWDKHTAKKASLKIK